MVIPARPADRVVHAPVGVAAKVGTETPAQVDAPPPSADTIGHQAYAAAAAATNTAKPSAAAKAAPDANAATATDANDTADAANNTATTTTDTTPTAAAADPPADAPIATPAVTHLADIVIVDQLRAVLPVAQAPRHYPIIVDGHAARRVPQRHSRRRTSSRAHESPPPPRARHPLGKKKKERDEWSEHAVRKPHPRAGRREGQPQPRDGSRR